MSHNSITDKHPQSTCTSNLITSVCSLQPTVCGLQPVVCGLVCGLRNSVTGILSKPYNPDQCFRTLHIIG